ncbi:MAG: lasso peptide biosynthesis B2 protein [Pseudonocardia sp.]
MTAAMATGPAAPTVPRAERTLAGACFRLAVVLLRLPLRRSVATVGWISRCTARPASVAEAEAAVAAVRAATRRYPGRAACLERSLATVLLTGLHRRRVSWCVGARLLPYAGHAWIEVDSHPVGEPAAPDRPYLPLFRV